MSRQVSRGSVGEYQDVYPKKFIGIYSGDSGSLTVNLTKVLELYTKILDITVCKLYVHNKLTKITRKK